MAEFKCHFRDVENRTTPTFRLSDPKMGGRFEPSVIYIDIQLQFGQIPMTAVAVQQYRPAMDSCMVGMRSYRTCALTVPDSSDPGEYGMLAYGKF